jgi:endonuclease-3
VAADPIPQARTSSNISNIMGGKKRTQTSATRASKAPGKAPKIKDAPNKAPKVPKDAPSKAPKIPKDAPSKAKQGRQGKKSAPRAREPAKKRKIKVRTKSSAGQRALPLLLEILAQTWSEAKVELDHESAYELLVATILAAQSTDRRINQVTPALFARYPNARSLAGADQAELEEQIRSTGFFRMKAKHLLGMARAVVEHHDGEIPRTMDELVALPGVARKTANVVLGSFFGIPAGIVVDTHVTRLARRLGLTTEDDPEKIERDLMAVIPREQWIDFAHRLIWHGRRTCFARKPACDLCPLAPLCPSAGIGARAIPAAAGEGLPENPNDVPNDQSDDRTDEAR